ncbi:MAG: phospholipase D-like domain-containing protein [Myxococcota bacterium]|nr:phospholipase D-like domain-containing protein [Myxococcota bacterium]
MRALRAAWRLGRGSLRAARARRAPWLTTFALLGLLACESSPTSSSSGSNEASLADAPRWLVRTEATGTWVVPEHLGTVHAWVDARVANVRFDKRVFVEVFAPYGDTAIRTLHVMEHRGPLGAFERWGADTIELFPAHGPEGRALTGPVLHRFRMQHDLGAGDVMVATPWEVLYGEGTPTPPVDDPWRPSEPSTRTSEAIAREEREENVDASGEREIAREDWAENGGESSESEHDEGDLPEVFFAPFEDPGAQIVRRIRALTERAQRGERPRLDVAVMNVNDRELEDAIVEAHRAGVRVRVVHDGRKHRPAYDWYRGDDRLLAAGVPLLGVRRPGRGAMHDKIVIFDGAELGTGSMNFETGARFENHESFLFTREASLLAAYAERFEAIAGGVLRPRSHYANARVSVTFAPDEEPHRVVGRLLDQARERIVVAMFTAKDVHYVEDGRPTSLHGKLVAAVARGVEVVAILDHGIHEASEHYGTITEDDPADEALAAAGVHVVLVDNPFGRYASMHHKTVVIDDAIAVTGAFNWYHDAAFLNDEDQLVWRSFDAGAWPHVEVELAVRHEGTRFGERLAVAGSLPELGAWRPEDAVVLDGTDYPIWRTRLALPIGVRFEAKAFVRGFDGLRWESGPNRALRVPSEPGTIAW